MRRVGTLFFSACSCLLVPAAAARRGRLPCVALCILALTYRSSAQQPAPPAAPAVILAAQLPEAPTPQLSVATLTGTIVDRDGDSIPGAHITLTHDTPASAGEALPRVAISTADGRFSFPDLSPGPFKLAIVAYGFVPREASGELHVGETLELPQIPLFSGSITDVQVTASQADIAEAQINQAEKQRVLAIFPNFYVSYIPNPVPLNAKQKFELAAKTLIDPVSFGLNGVAAGVQQGENTFSGYGQGSLGYSKRYAADYGSFLTGTLIGGAALPILLKQDPRYFYKGTGSIHSRVLYAIANAVICKGDNHRWQFNYSSIFGSLAAAGLANLYIPTSNRSGAGEIFEGTAALGTGISAVTNLLQEFLVRKLTPHVPSNPPLNP
jgi:hypothetical protein